MKYPALATIIMALCGLAAGAQGYGALAVTDSLPLVPYPKHVVAGSTDFKVPSSLVINVASGSDEDQFAAATFTADFKQLKATIKSGGKLAKQSITLTRPGNDRTADKRLRDAGLELDTASAEGYLLLADADGVIVAGNTAAGVFYGVQTLRQLTYADASGNLRVRAVKIEDEPALKIRWVQDDWSRGPIPTIDYVKQQIRTMAEYKLNGYCIYGENIFQSAKYPEINLRGATITPAEQRELTAYAKQYHITMVPQQEALGHMHYTLRSGSMDDIAERHDGQVLSPAAPRTYTFLNDYLGEILPNFDSPWVHVGCDEAFELGLGKSKEMVDKMGKDAVFMLHMQRLAALPALKGKKIMFWGDVAENKKDIDLSPLPKNCIAVVWDYLPRDNYEYYLPQFQRNGVPTIVAPGAYWSGRVFPDFPSHMTNIQHLVRDGKKYGTQGMMVCTWDDMGEDMFDTGWYSVAYAAACAWQHERETSVPAFSRAFDWAFYRNIGGHEFATAIDSVASVHNQLGTTLWYDWATSVPFEKAGADQVKIIQASGKLPQLRAMLARAYASLLQCQGKAQLHQSTIEPLQFAARRMGYVFVKADLALNAKKRYQDMLNDDDKGRPVNTAVYDLVIPYAGMIGSLRDYTKELKAWHHELWLRSNRPTHWDIVETRYNHQLQAWDDEEARLRQALGTTTPPEQVGFLF